LLIIEITSRSTLYTEMSSKRSMLAQVRGEAAQFRIASHHWHLWLRIGSSSLHNRNEIGQEITTCWISWWYARSKGQSSRRQQEEIPKCQGSHLVIKSSIYLTSIPYTDRKPWCIFSASTNQSACSCRTPGRSNSKCHMNGDNRSSDLFNFRHPSKIDLEPSVL
jgi:hypothetical protein